MHGSNSIVTTGMQFLSITIVPTEQSFRANIPEYIIMNIKTGTVHAHFKCTLLSFTEPVNKIKAVPIIIWYNTIKNEFFNI